MTAPVTAASGFADRALTALATQGIGAVIAIVLVTQIQARLDVLIQRVGDVVTACSTR